MEEARQMEWPETTVSTELVMNIIMMCTEMDCSSRIVCFQDQAVIKLINLKDTLKPGLRPNIINPMAIVKTSNTLCLTGEEQPRSLKEYQVEVDRPPEISIMKTNPVIIGSCDQPSGLEADPEGRQGPAEPGHIVTEEEKNNVTMQGKQDKGEKKAVATIAARIEELKCGAKKGSPGGRKTGSGRKKKVVDLSMIPRIDDFMKSMGGRKQKRKLEEEAPEPQKKKKT